MTISIVNPIGLRYGLAPELRWVVELLARWRTSPNRSRLEERVFGQQMYRLKREQPAQYEAIDRSTRPGALWTKEDEPAIVAGIQQLAQWVDEVMETK